MKTMNLRKRGRWLAMGLALSTAWCGWAQQSAPESTTAPAPPPSSGAKFSTAELEKLVAPIALYPDPLLATVLPASVYPLEIVQAARFVADTNNLTKLDEQPWDDSVKAVARVPDAIKKLNEDIAWTMELGEAFLAQDKDVMDAIQSMRGRAQKAGTLQTTPQQIVTVTNMIVEKTVEQQVVMVTNTIVQIAPTSSSVVYVPSYPYTVYYPPPGYVYNPYAPLVTFGVGIAVGAIIANNCDWYHGGCYHGNVNINVNNNYNRNNNFNQNNNINRVNQNGQQKWQPDQSRLSKSGATSASSREARGWSGASGQAGQRPTTGSVGSRPSQSPGVAAQPARTAGAASAVRPAAQPTGARTTSTWQQPAASRPSSSPGINQPSVRQPSVQQPSVRQPSVQQPSVNRSASSPGNRSSAAPSVNRPASQPSSAFSGVNNGARANNYSNRGAASRGNVSRGGGARGGGGRR